MALEIGSIIDTLPFKALNFLSKTLEIADFLGIFLFVILRNATECYGMLRNATECYGMTGK